MTDMKRVCFAINNDIDQRILALRRRDKYIRLTYSEIIRQTLAAGLLALEAETTAPGEDEAGEEN